MTGCACRRMAWFYQATRLQQMILHTLFGLHKASLATGEFERYSEVLGRRYNAAGVLDCEVCGQGCASVPEGWGTVVKCLIE